MKNRCFVFLSAIVLWFSVQAQAQDLIFTGTVAGVSADSGTMILSKGPQMKITLSGLQQARVRAVDGRLVGLSNVRPGMKVSVAYLPVGQQWVVSRILVPAVAQPEDACRSLPTARYWSLFDGDVTTNPGSKAAVDGDITTKPAGNANRDGDITTKADR